MDLGRNIKIFRNKEGVSQKELAKHLNVTRQAVSNWERGKTEPDAQMIKDISDFFDIDVNELFSYGLDSSINRDALKILFIISIIMVTLHLVGVFLKLNNIFTFINVPGLVLFILFIIRMTFSSSIKNNDYSIIAGYKKGKDSNSKTKKQLYYIEIFIQIIAILCNSLYFITYFADSENVMFASLIIMFIFISGIAISSIIVNEKVN